MTKEFWLSLPVKSLARSKEFFTSLGFSFTPGPGNTDTSAPLMIGNKNVVVMLFEEAFFKGCTNNEIADTSKVTEVLLSFDAESREEVDEIANKAVAAGGTLFGKPSEVQGWMYSCGFTDLDGHRWNVLYMDMNKVQKCQ